MQSWHKGLTKAITKKGNQQIMKAPVTIARVFAAFFSRLASREMCFFSFLGFLRSLGGASGARSSVWHPILAWRMVLFLCRGQIFSFGVAGFSPLWEDGDSSVFIWGSLESCERSFVSWWLTGDGSFSFVFSEFVNEVVSTFPLADLETCTYRMSQVSDMKFVGSNSCVWQFTSKIYGIQVSFNIARKKEQILLCIKLHTLTSLFLKLVARVAVWMTLACGSRVFCAKRLRNLVLGIRKISWWAYPVMFTLQWGIFASREAESGWEEQKMLRL